MGKNIYFLVNTEIIDGKTAAAARLLNYAKALSLENNRIFLCSAVPKTNLNKDIIAEVFPNIFIVANIPIKVEKRIVEKLINENSLIFFIKYFREIKKLIRQTGGDRVILLYPSYKVLFDFLCLTFFKIFNSEKIYFEANEVRKFWIYNTIFSRNYLRKFFQILMVCSKYLEYSYAEHFIRYFDGLIAISTNIEQYYKRYNHNILRIPILSDASEKPFSSYPVFNKHTERFRICFTGSINLKKEGFDLLYESLANIKKRNVDFELHLYGSISAASKELLLEILPQKLNIKENIFYHGFIESRKIIGKLQRHHLLILPRPLTLQTKYGFSTKLSEYLVSGIPVLLTNVSDNGLFIKDNFNGFLIEPGSIESMTKKLLYIIENYNEVVEKIVNSAFETAKNHFHYVNFSRNISNFFK